MSTFWTFASSYPSYKKYTSEFIVKKLFENSTDKTLYNDMKKGMHINVFDYTKGKGDKAIKEVIPFNGNKDDFNRYLKQLNK